ncbi:MAG: AraC family transcriptional regulator [Clostridia bacterium]|nr:AraC family transcriptional regulator [Clostridia bacterium]
MYKSVYVNKELTDINPRKYGGNDISVSTSLFSGHTSLYYISNGKGTLEKDNRTFEISRGNIFVTKRNETVTLTPDRDSSIAYYFVCFDGTLAADFEDLPPIFQGEERLFKEIYAIEDTSIKGISLLAACIFELYSKYCLGEKSNSDDYVENIKNYIALNYQNNISVGQIASILHLSRAYIARIFKKNVGISIIEYLITYRVKKAAELIKNGESITKSAYLCGFGDLSNFSKTFKKYIGISPKQYKKSIN